MAYIPPHRRNSNGNQDQLRPSPTGPRSLRNNGSRNGIWRRFTVGFAEDGQSLPPVRLRTVSVGANQVNQEQGEEVMAIVKHSVLAADSQRNQENIAKPWEYIADRLMQSLLPSVETARKHMEREGLDSIKAHFVARAGTLLFLGREELNGGLVDEVSLGKLRRWFNANVPSSYMDNIVADFVPKIGLQYGEFKDVYHVFLADKLGNNKSTLSCKCRFVEEEKRLEPYKIELQRVNYMRLDFSCLEKNMDLRLMLYTKRTMTSLTDSEKRSIKDLIGSSVVDPTIKGGIRWPFGRTTSSDNRYVIHYVCHTTTRDYVNSSMRLRVRVADTGDPKFSSSTGEVNREMTLKLKGICSHLMEKELDTAVFSDILKDEMKLLWDHFLQSEKFIM